VLALAGFVGLWLLVGLADGSVVAGTARAWYASLHRPLGTPPNWAFAAACTALYVMIGIAAWLVWRRSVSNRPLRLWGWQLAANACWTPAFFALRSPPLALAVCLVLLALTARTMLSFWRVRPQATWLMVPYLGWSCFATYLTAGFWWLNPP
jgi:tryptophan-rich sensory protein